VNISARIIGHGRSVIFQMAEVAVPRGPFQQILAAIATKDEHFIAFQVRHLQFL
jgi:hypothetical protein